MEEDQFVEDSPKPIEVYFNSKGKFLVYDSNDVWRLRTEFRIVGSLIGGIQKFKQQNIFCSLPLLLIPEEVVLLLKKDIIILLDDTQPYPTPTSNEIKQFHEDRKRDFQIEQQSVENDKKKKAELYLHNGNKSKKRKINNNDLKSNDADVELQDKSEISNDTNITKTEENKSKDDNTINKNQSKHNEGLISETVIIKMKSTRKREYKKFQWNFPTSKNDKLKCKVFEDLWNRNYFVTNGSKFGGDFLAYPGDPLEYHALYVIIVKQFNESISPLDLISFARLSLTVKKSPVVASVREIEEDQHVINDNRKSDIVVDINDRLDDNVTYFTMDWQGVA